MKVNKTILYITLLIILVSTFTGCRIKSHYTDSIKISKRNSEIAADIDSWDRVWKKDNSQKFSYLEFKPTGGNIPFFDEDWESSNNNFLYISEDSGQEKYGVMDFEFYKITELISTEAFVFSNGIARINNDESHKFINSDFDILNIYYPGYLYIDKTIIEINESGNIDLYSFTVNDINPKSYLVPAKLYLNNEIDSEYLVGFTFIKNVSSGSELTEKDFIITPRFNEARLFHEGLAAVKKDGEWGYIDYTGELVIDFSYKEANNFSCGVAGVYYEYINNKYDREVLNLFWNIIDKSGKLIGGYEYVSIGEFVNDAAVARLIEKNLGNIQTFINTEGEDLLGQIPSTLDLRPFKEGFQVICIGTEWYYINSEYKNAFNRVFPNAIDFNEGYAAVKPNQGWQWGYMDTSGSLVIEEKYLYTGNFSSGFAYVFNRESKTGYLIDISENKYLEELNLSRITKFNEEGYALAYGKDETTPESDDFIYYMIKKDD